MKICKECKVEKPVTEFWVRSDKHYVKKGNYYYSYCKPCSLARHRDWNKTPNGIISKKTTVVKRYGLTIKEYDKMVKTQNGLCAICHKPEKALNRGNLTNLSPDHNHITKKVRGLLCRKCNDLLGRAEDSIELLQNSIEYLKHY